MAKSCCLWCNYFLELPYDDFYKKHTFVKPNKANDLQMNSSLKLMVNWKYFRYIGWISSQL